jgi:hypothetical protein
MKLREQVRLHTEARNSSLHFLVVIDHRNDILLVRERPSICKIKLIPQPKLVPAFSRNTEEEKGTFIRRE